MLHQSAGFSWEHADVRAGRMRIVIAVALLSVGWMTGFFSGRVSAWIVPVASSSLAPLEKIPAQDYASMQTAAATAAARKNEAKFQIAAAAALARAARTMNFEAAAAAPHSDGIFEWPPQAAGEPSGVARKPGSSKRTGEPEARERVNNLPNTHWTTIAPRPRHRDIDDDVYEKGGVTACEGRYASFRRSDGTYQPFNSTLRERCPLLR
jgi:hypothetical protein